ncbi:MAG: RNA 2',3'-cyclic phosphodiesterase [Desulfobulbaceae bacterium]|nr:RNA 2',3'-cyclic phosphodiesterase [Candidatus Kapabacteria bacterium]MBS3999431.1 RNA 2',3'-cyclic phosphodiesterase [Desulfobulbaceae bacterium]
MAVKRLFIGTFIDYTLFEPIYNEIVDELGEVVFGKWTEINNLHFTYKFLGNIEIDKIDSLIEGLGDILKQKESPLKIRGLGCFPTANKPRIVYARVFNPDNSVINSYHIIESRMKKLGFAPEIKHFVPHVTLMRVKSHLTGFSDKLKTYNNMPIGLMPSYKISLIESTLTNKGPNYNILA